MRISSRPLFVGQLASERGWGARKRAGLPGPLGASAAFTLIEVLAALAVFAFCAIVLASAYLNILNSYDVVERYFATGEDVAFARRLVLTEPDREKLEEGGEFESSNGGRVHWEVQIEPTTMPDLFTVTFTCDVTDPQKTEPEKTVQTFTLLRPTWSIDAAERDKLREEVKTRILELKAEMEQGRSG